MTEISIPITHNLKRNIDIQRAHVLYLIYFHRIS